MKNKYITIAVVLVLVGVGAFIRFTKKGNSLIHPTTQGQTQDASAVVATIRGGQISISRAQLDVQIQQSAQNPQVKVPDASQGEARSAFEKAVLDQMVKSALFLDEAQRQGFTVDDTAVEAELAKITASYQDAAAFDAALASAQLTKDMLRENIKRQLVTKQYYSKIVAEHPVKVTAEEIKGFYDTQVVPQDPKAVFEKIKDQIKTQLEQQKVQEVVKGIVDELYKSADVKVLI